MANTSSCLFPLSPFNYQYNTSCWDRCSKCPVQSFLQAKGNVQQPKGTVHEHRRSGCVGRVRGERKQVDRRDVAADQQECGCGLIRCINEVMLFTMNWLTVYACCVQSAAYSNVINSTEILFRRRSGRTRRSNGCFMFFVRRSVIVLSSTSAFWLRLKILLAQDFVGAFSRVLFPRNCPTLLHIVRVLPNASLVIGWK